jgi:hypothetical protein
MEEVVGKGGIMAVLVEGCRFRSLSFGCLALGLGGLGRMRNQYVENVAFCLFKIKNCSI